MSKSLNLTGSTDPNSLRNLLNSEWQGCCKAHLEQMFQRSNHPTAAPPYAEQHHYLPGVTKEQLWTGVHKNMFPNEILHGQEFRIKTLLGGKNIETQP